MQSYISLGFSRMSQKSNIATDIMTARYFLEKRVFHMMVSPSKLYVLLACLVFLCAAVSKAMEQKSQELKRGRCAVQCTVTDSQAVKSFRELRNTARLVYNSQLPNISKADDCHDFEIEKNLGKAGMEFVWASRHTEPFISLEKDFKRFAVAISNQLVRHIRISVSCMVRTTTTHYKMNVMEAVASTLLIDVSESIGTVCFKANDQYDQRCCKARKSGTAIHCDLQEQSVNIWLKLLRDFTVFVTYLVYFYITFFISAPYFNTNRRSVNDQIKLSRSDLMDCLHVYFEANRNLFQASPWKQRLGHFLSGVFIVPFVFYIILAFRFTCDWPHFLFPYFGPFHLMCSICYFVREGIKLLPPSKSPETEQSTEQQSSHNSCFICALLPREERYVAEVRDSHVKAMDWHLKLLPRAICMIWKRLFEKFCQYTILSQYMAVAVASVFFIIPVFAVYIVCSFTWGLICFIQVFVYFVYFKLRHVHYPSLSSRFSVFDRRPCLAFSFNLIINGLAFIGFLFIGVVTSTFIVRVAVYFIMLLSLDHENYLTLVAGIFLVIYYVCHSIRSVASKYGHLKLVLFKCYTKHPQHKHVRQANQDCQEQELKIPSDLYMKVCDKVDLKAVNFLLMVRDLVVVLSFVFIVIACVIIFGPRPGEINSFFKGLVTMVIGLAPRVSTLLSSSETDKEKKRMELENQVQGVVEEYFQELVENQDERFGREDIHQSRESDEEEGGLFRGSFWAKCHKRWLQRHSMEENMLSGQCELLSNGDIQQRITSLNLWI